MPKLTCITNRQREEAARRGFAVPISESLPPKRPVGGFRDQRRRASHDMRWVEFALLGATALPALLSLAL